MAYLSKIFGWVLVAAGVILIAWTLYSSYNIFTGKTAAPEFFGLKKEIAGGPTAPSGELPTSPAELQKRIEGLIGEQLKGLLPLDTIPKLLNLAVWTMLAWILIFGGAQLSSLGIKLLRK